MVCLWSVRRLVGIVRAQVFLSSLEVTASSMVFFWGGIRILFATISHPSFFYVDDIFT